MRPRPLTPESAPGEIGRFIHFKWKLPRADELGHRTRFSDSSSYDERCILCGETDRTPEPLKLRCTEPVSDEEYAALLDPPKVEKDWDPQA